MHPGWLRCSSLKYSPLIRFNEPAIRDGRAVSGFTNHHLQVNVGLGLRF
jgi:hypothetical protein